MKFGHSLGAAATAFALAFPAFSPATAAPLAPIAIGVVAPADSPVSKVGYRHERYERYNGGISYVGSHGLKYAPTYWHRGYQDVDVTINIYAEEPPRREYPNRTRPLIIELPR